ncbi:UNVERIFIED_CONTAM: Aldehyde oxidase GLOX1 [Sesamum radiatum]|uniref:Aldehyde oxidase GLOX1 n=1 Tax=Sesamum radiatum TaxID=300843 RepID=A0AAW2SJU3_SESRA
MSPSLFLSFILRHLLLVLLLLLLPHRNVLTRAAGGRWDFLLSNIGISAMHMQLLYTDRVVIFDRTDFGVSNISLPAGKCRNDPSDTALVNDCTAHSVEYDVATNSVRPLMVLTDTWCSSGAVMPDGTLVQTGGYNDGDHTVRLYKPCTNNSCDWREINPGLTQRRWYATNHILPDGRAIVVGGRRQHNYEFYPKTSPADTSYKLDFLVETKDPKIENNLYPFVFLNVDGNLFIFANNRAILFDYVKGTVVRTYPTIPGGDPRSYPSTGSAVLLPMTENSAGSAEVLVCGGAPKGAYLSAMNGRFVTALDTCAKIRINDPNPEWVMETMPMPRVMGDMVLLPNANVLIINGAGSGAAGWELGRNPVLAPVVYRPTNPLGSRFEVQSSNPNFKNLRPRIVSPTAQTKIGYNQQLTVLFTFSDNLSNDTSIMVTMVVPAFTTHSCSMNQRLIVLSGGNVTAANGNSTYQIRVMMPYSGNIAQPGYYLLFVVHQDVPSEGIWVQIS